MGVLHAQRGSEPVTLNFVNADIEAVARAMAAITGRNIVVDPRVKGTVTLTPEKPVSPGAAYNQFLATLRMSSAAVVDADGQVRVGVGQLARRRAGRPVLPAGKQSVMEQRDRQHQDNDGRSDKMRPE